MENGRYRRTGGRASGTVSLGSAFNVLPRQRYTPANPRCDLLLNNI